MDDEEERRKARMVQMEEDMKTELAQRRKEIEAREKEISKKEGLVEGRSQGLDARYDDLQTWQAQVIADLR